MREYHSDMVVMRIIILFKVQAVFSSLPVSVPYRKRPEFPQRGLRPQQRCRRTQCCQQECLLPQTLHMGPVNNDVSV